MDLSDLTNLDQAPPVIEAVQSDSPSSTDPTSSCTYCCRCSCSSLPNCSSLPSCHFLTCCCCTPGVGTDKVMALPLPAPKKRDQPKKIHKVQGSSKHLLALTPQALGFSLLLLFLPILLPLRLVPKIHARELDRQIDQRLLEASSKSINTPFSM
ncbi:hypothetical protein BJ742DRAFT_197634 [Cladochytrium replicatum]|nr:hypothetical protein BJ742DRAFT_197634 [Cladochytrium replicatum]